ncbi:class I fructose-bisphosphate aldolase [Thermosulfidibacter takaii]|nr:fructose-bisphosphate aldolase [Thermosulfidibacter takaii]
MGIDLSVYPMGKRARLYKLFYDKGVGNGKAILLPIDQGLEHGPSDFFENPDSANPEYQIKIALEGGYSAIVVHIGLAEKFLSKYAGQIPLVLKINGKTNIPPDDEALSPLVARVEDAVRLGADAIGYTLYVGTPKQFEDIRQFMEVRREAERLGMPVIVWAYPRGRYVEMKGGKNSLYAIDYAARVAAEVGADVIKLNIPKLDVTRAAEMPEPYRSLIREMDEFSAIKKVIDSACGVPVIIAGGEKGDKEKLLEKARLCAKAGAKGFIFGRNIWKRPINEALELTRELKRILRESE